MLHSTDYGITINIVYHLIWFLKAVAQRAIQVFFFFPGEFIIILDYTSMYAVEMFASKKYCSAFVSIEFTLLKYCYSLGSNKDS